MLVVVECCVIRNESSIASLFTGEQYDSEAEGSAQTDAFGSIIMGYWTDWICPFCVRAYHNYFMEVAIAIEAISSVVPIIQQGGGVVSGLVNVYKNIKTALFGKDETLKAVFEVFEQDCDNEAMASYLKDRLQRSPALQEDSVKALLVELQELLKAQQGGSSQSSVNSPGAKQVQARDIYVHRDLNLDQSTGSKKN